ncbi:MAG: phage holin family protein [Candidatus Gracilibacteria bacterium]
MLKSIFIRLGLNALTLYLVIYMMPDIRYTGGLKFFLVAGLILTILNMFLKPLLKILAFPFLVVTAGLFMAFVNAFLLWILTFMLHATFPDVSLVIPTKGSYLIAGLLFGLLNWVLNTIFRK